MLTKLKVSCSNIQFRHSFKALQIMYNSTSEIRNLKSIRQRPRQVARVSYFELSVMLNGSGVSQIHWYFGVKNCESPLGPSNYKAEVKSKYWLSIGNNVTAAHFLRTADNSAIKEGQAQELDKWSLTAMRDWHIQKPEEPAHFLRIVSGKVTGLIKQRVKTTRDPCHCNSSKVNYDRRNEHQADDGIVLLTVRPLESTVKLYSFIGMTSEERDDQLFLDELCNLFEWQTPIPLRIVG